jgi:hypothetical protein
MTPEEKMAGNGDINLPRGIDMPITEKIEIAVRIACEYSDLFDRDRMLSGYLAEYGNAIEKSWQAMEVSGITGECTACAVNDGGSCCGKGIEDKFDIALLVVNILLGSRLPERREDPEGCWFLSSGGCSIRARHVICVNYLCKRLYENIEPEAIRAFQQAMEHETTLAFMAEERVKHLVRQSMP